MPSISVKTEGSLSMALHLACAPLDILARNGARDAINVKGFGALPRILRIVLKQVSQRGGGATYYCRRENSFETSIAKRWRDYYPKKNSSEAKISHRGGEGRVSMGLR